MTEAVALVEGKNSIQETIVEYDLWIGSMKRSYYKKWWRDITWHSKQPEFYKIPSNRVNRDKQTNVCVRRFALQGILNIATNIRP